jgi:hypothetical protein
MHVKKSRLEELSDRGNKLTSVCLFQLRSEFLRRDADHDAIVVSGDQFVSLPTQIAVQIGIHEVRRVPQRQLAE